MAVSINGSTGITNVDGSAGTPAEKGSTSATAGMFFPAANTVAFSTSSTEAMRINSSNQVGIGTTSPTNLLHVVSSGDRPLKVTSNSDTPAVFTSSGSANAYLQVSGSADVYLGSVAGAFTVTTGGTEKMRLDTSGNLSIGLNNGTGKVTISATGNSNHLYLLGAQQNAMQFLTASGGGGFIIGRSLAANNSNDFFFYDSVAATPRLYIAAGGQVVSGSGSYQNGTRLLAYDNSTTNVTLGGFYSASTSYASAVQVIWCDRSSNSAYGFLVTRNASDTNTAHYLRGDGNAYADGTWNNNGADYAEYFESVTGQEIPVGTTVVLDGNKVRASTDQDAPSSIIGVVRPKEPSIASMVVGNTAWNKWQGMFLTDDFGRYVLETHDVIEWDEVKDLGDGKTETDHKSYESHMIPDGVTVPDNAIRKSVDEKGKPFTHYKINPDYDPAHEYVPREERPEWLIIGLVGQVPVLKGQPTGDRWIKMRDISNDVAEYMIR